MSSLAYLATEALTAGVLAAQSAANKQPAAQTASNVAAYFTALGKGDAVSAQQEVSTAITSIKDPGLQKVATDLWAAGQPFLTLELQTVENLPVLGGSLQQAFTDIGAGMASVAGAYLSAPKS